MIKPFAALADWGTSNFRLWIVDANGDVLAERQSGEGMGGLTREQYAGVLEGHLAALDAPADLPVMIAGMAGARTGWVEVPYLEAPADLSQVARGAFTVPHDRRPVHILPGVCQKSPLPFDVMRGEETQLAGAAATGHSDGVFCLPGTHSKWAELEGGTLKRFATVMTGEIYDLLASKSILRLSVDAGAPTTPDMPDFIEGVSIALDPAFALTASLFSIRAAALLADLQPAAAAARLSGLLIGHEIAGVRGQWGATGTVRLIGSSRLNALYGKALRIAGQNSEILDGAQLVRHGLFSAARMTFPQQG